MNGSYQGKLSRLRKDMSTPPPVLCSVTYLPDNLDRDSGQVSLPAPSRERRFWISQDLCARFFSELLLCLCLVD